MCIQTVATFLSLPLDPGYHQISLSIKMKATRNQLLLQLLSSPSSSSSSLLCRVLILIFLRQTISLGNTVLQLFCCYYSWCLYLSSSVESIVLLHQCFPKYVCSAQYDCFLEFLDLCFPGMLLTYFLNDFEIVPVAPIIIGITFVFTFQMPCISIVRSFYLKIFSASFLIIFLSTEFATSINIHVPFSLSRIIMSGLLLGIVLSVYYYYYYY